MFDATLGMQYFCSHLRTKEMLDDVEDINYLTSFNIMQDRATWWSKECNMLDSTMLDDVASVWPGLK